MSWNELKEHLDEMTARMKKLNNRLEEMEEAATHIDPEDELGETKRALIISLLRATLEGEVGFWRKLSLSLAAILGFALVALVLVLAV